MSPVRAEQAWRRNSVRTVGVVLELNRLVGTLSHEAIRADELTVLGLHQGDEAGLGGVVAVAVDVTLLDQLALGQQLGAEHAHEAGLLQMAAPPVDSVDAPPVDLPGCPRLRR